MVSFFLGLTMALLTGYQLERFGTERLVPGSGRDRFHPRAGPAPHRDHARGANRRGVHRGTRHDGSIEEVEAIEAMGISPLRFLVAPRMLALFALMPCLVCDLERAPRSSRPALISYAYFNIALVYFNDLVLNSLLIRDIITGIMKSFLFGLLIARDRLLPRAQCQGGAAGVGNFHHLERGHGDHGGDRFRHAF